MSRQKSMPVGPCSGVSSTGPGRKSNQLRFSVLVYDDLAFPTLQRVEGQVDVVGCEVSEPGGPVDEDVFGTGSESNELRVGGRLEVHFPADPLPDCTSAGIKERDIVC
jgi:hypothetical protein